MSNQTIHIEIVGNMARIDPGVSDLLSSELAYDELCFETGGAQGHRRLEEHRRLFEEDDQGGTVIPAGFVPRIVRCLEKHGHRVDVTDPRVRKQRETGNLNLLEGMEPEHQTFLEAVDREPVGQILLSSADDLVRHLALICRFYPTARILIATSRRNQATDVKDLLADWLNESVGMAVGRNWSSANRVVTCTYACVESCRPEEWDILLLPEAFEAVTDSRGPLVAKTANWRVYGFSLAETDPGQRAQLRLEAICGPVIYQTLGRDGWKADVHVKMLQSITRAVSNAKDPLERKRANYWHNDRRNDQIAALARQNSEEMAQVTILVEGSEHGKQLLRRLPGWTLLHRSTAHVDGLPLDRTILTLARASQLDTLDTDVLIYAAGGQWPESLTCFPPRAQEARVLLVDLLDTSNTFTQDSTQRRMAFYSKKGWKIDAPPSWHFQTTGCETDEDAELDAAIRSR